MLNYVTRALAAIVLLNVFAWMLDPVRYPLPFLQVLKASELECGESAPARSRLNGRQASFIESPAPQSGSAAR